MGNDPQWLRRGEAWSGVFRARHKDGATFPTWVTDTPVFDDCGEGATRLTSRRPRLVAPGPACTVRS